MHTNSTGKKNMEVKRSVTNKILLQSGHNVDPAKYRKQNEKITDTLRGMFEKATGKKVCFTMWSRGSKTCSRYPRLMLMRLQVPSKFSN